MFGIPSLGVALAFILSVASAIVCVVYAWRNWNAGDAPAEPDDEKWLAEEKKEAAEEL
jgi:hypothetical protein